MPILVNLPQEVIDDIVCTLASDKNALCAAALAGRVFLPAARAQLYMSITPTDELLEFFESSLHLLEHVKDVRLDAFHCNVDGPQGSPIWKHIPRRLRQLHLLNLSPWDKLCPEFRDFLLEVDVSVMRTPPLWWSGPVSASHRAFWQTFPSLTSLDIPCSFSVPEDDEKFGPVTVMSVAFPKLRRLHMIAAPHNEAYLLRGGIDLTTLEVLSLASWITSFGDKTDLPWDMLHLSRYTLRTLKFKVINSVELREVLGTGRLDLSAFPHLNRIELSLVESGDIFGCLPAFLEASNKRQTRSGTTIVVFLEFWLVTQEEADLNDDLGDLAACISLPEWDTVPGLLSTPSPSATRLHVNIMIHGPTFWITDKLEDVVLARVKSMCEAKLPCALLQTDVPFDMHCNIVYDLSPPEMNEKY
ncbi:hypothetical protein FISHEDRAFT_72111 [Fistulina hepatica ATCC 64428]|uniref:Uncharacterized protein n=1 Tax=Fistulina hepatica ATCC 64428 TaxID=1128425 RepID=A0A0D7AIB2_9AGAR|nr:hypothetical protein FISHEDRAFT_72111 [Fistulina hepatica ATCC 64428]